MRRLSVVLSTVLAAGALLAAAPAAEAYDVCAWAYTESTQLPEVHTGVTCVAYPYGVICQHHHTWLGTAVDVYVSYCVPRPI